MRIIRDRKNRVLHLDQQTYIEKILNKYGMNEVKSIDSPGTPLPLLKLDNKLSVFDEKQQNYYQQLTGSILYPSISTRPDISHAVAIVSRYNSKAQQAHLTAVKRIYRYLHKTKACKLILDGKVNNKITNNIQLTAYSDSDWAGDLEDRKSTTGYIIKLNNCPISWISKKQKSTSVSTAEAEIVAAGAAIKEIKWLQQFLVELKLIPTEQPTKLFIDNTSSIDITNKDMANTKTKHIAIQYYFIKEAIDNQEIHIEWISTKDQLADIFTKPLGPQAFSKHKIMLMGEC